jgi:hypothetical protein
VGDSLPVACEEEGAETGPPRVSSSVTEQPADRQSVRSGAGLDAVNTHGVLSMLHMHWGHLLDVNTEVV